MAGLLIKKCIDPEEPCEGERIVYVAIPTTDTTHVSTNPQVVYVKVSPGQTLKQAMTALGL